MMSSGFVRTDRAPTMLARPSATICGSGIQRIFQAAASAHNLLLLLSKPLDSKAHDVAFPQIHRRLLAVTDSGGRAGGNDVARQQAHEPAQVADEILHAEDQRLCRSILVS